MTTHFHSSKRIAVVLSARLGDSLLFMSLANGFLRGGRAVTVFSTQISALSRWFPAFDIQPVPPSDRVDGVLDEFDAVVQMHSNRPLAFPAQANARFSCFDKWRASASKQLRAEGSPALLGELAIYARDVFGVTFADNRNGIVAPAGLHHRVHPARVIIHPTAGAPEGCWPRDKYAKLAQALVSQGFTPEFVVEHRERAQWLGNANRYSFNFVDASSLDALAAYIYESGWFIGSDSGVGHLASASGIPTVTICERIRNMRRWKPAWANAVVVEPVWLPLGALRRRYWREATTLSRVIRAFEKIRAEAVETIGRDQPNAARGALSEE